MDKGIAIRDIKNSKIQQKKLLPGDTIIEKSGGSPNQPVGRVVYFDVTDDTFLCNNFTSILRPKPDVDKKYFFWSLFNLHQRGVTLSFQNKTTGIINLQLKRYVEKAQIPLPPLSEQRRLAARLDKADAVRQKSRALVEAYAELGRSVFLEVFGDIHRNNKWKEEPLEKVIKEIKSGTSYSGDDRPLQKNEFGVLKISAVTSGRFKPEYKAVPKDSIDKELVFVEPGDLLFSRANTRELVAATCIVDDEYPNLFLPDKLWRIRLDQTLANPIFFKYVLSYPPFRSRITKKATGTSGSMLNVSMKKLKETYFPLPPLPLQARFAAMVANIEAQRRLAERQLAAAEAVFGGVLQGTFEG